MNNITTTMTMITEITKVSSGPSSRTPSLTHGHDINVLHGRGGEENDPADPVVTTTPCTSRRTLASRTTSLTDVPQPATTGHITTGKEMTTTITRPLNTLE